MLAIITVLVALLLSMLITRIATIALAVTGLSRESARFQARSAFTGVGFTTSEAEGVVNHPVRRRVILILMLLGNAGLVTIVASLLISFSGADASQAWHRIVLLLAGLATLFFLATNQKVDRAMSRMITRLLHRFTDLDVRDYAQLLQLQGGFGVIELQVVDDHWTAGKTLDDLQLRREGIAVLGIQRRDGSFEGVPRGASVVRSGDTLVLYGHTHLLTRFGERRAGPEGDAEHEQEAADHQREMPEPV